MLFADYYGFWCLIKRPASFEAEDLSLGYEEEDDDPDTGEDWELRSFRV